jgi:uncharacterized protein YndB with AHSA1/START domain
MNDNVIYTEYFYAHPPASVWRVLTTPELVARWWAPGDMRAIAGHQFELDMGQWGMQRCEVLAVQPERLLTIRFATDTLDTTISWALTPEEGGTRLKLTHAGFNLDSPMGRHALEGMKPGWPTVLARLDQVLTKLE